MKTFSISQLAQQAGVHVETVRYYERRGLLPEPPRSASGYRRYAMEDVRRLRFIRRAQVLGFSLEDIHDLLELRVREGSTCADVQHRAQDRLASIEERLRDLQAMKQALSHLITTCQDDRPGSECPILDAIEKEDSQWK